VASPSQALIIRFATDLEPAKRGLTELASNAYQKFSTVKMNFHRCETISY
jgi:hypothetical protein